MTETWRSELRAWAYDCAANFQRQPGILGVVIGGSIARGQEWQHSDLEMGILVEQFDPARPYFNIIGGRGVEAIQLVRPSLEEQVCRAERGDLSPVSEWPIQLYTCRIVSDPTGLLTRFQKQFDAGLFQPEIVAQKIALSRQHIEQHLGEARRLLAEQKPRAALAMAREAMNESILAVHWAHGVLPRSQNRTDSRLHRLCRQNDILPFYELYREVFALANLTDAIKTRWPRVKDAVLEITRLWGDSARDFFNFAVDGNFQWRQNAGILTVYRLYVPIIGMAGPNPATSGQGIFTKLDDPEWASQNPDLLVFLGLDQADQAAVTALVERIAAAGSYYA
jgi:hypothetical protein